MKTPAARDKLYQYAKANIPAYRDFLRKRHVRLARLRSEDDFKKLPITDKRSYLKAYPLESLFPKKRLPPLAYASSGSSGAPTFWFRDIAQEKVGKAMHEGIMNNIFGINAREPTLVVISFGMGIWIAGHYTFASFKRIAEKGRAISIITPGFEKEDLVRTFAHLAPRFAHVVLVGYPPFVMDIVTELERRKIKMPRSMKLITSGDKFTEIWRDTIAKRTGIKDVHRGIVGVYGSADAIAMGHETPLSIFIRRAARANTALRNALWSEDELHVPGIVQYDPNHVFFEHIGEELVLTTATATPLIRYNIHDRGTVISYEKMKNTLARAGLAREAERYGLNDWKLPFLILKGRTDVAVTFYAFNIYPEHIKACLERPPLSKIASGDYLAYNKNVHRERDQKLYLTLELKRGVKPTARLRAAAERAVLEALTEVCSEFRKTHAALGARAVPDVRLVPHGALKMPNAKGRGIFGAHGKKPRVVVV